MSKIDEIVLNNCYPSYVLASAGTGKTELIAQKVEQLIINEGVDIDKIALITFTNKATAETISRIKTKIYNSWLNGNTKIRPQIDKLSMAKISTIHTFCDNILRQYSFEIGLCANYTIANLTLEKDKLANEIIKDNYNEKIFKVFPMYKIEKLLKNIEEKASDKGIDIVLNEIETKSIWDELRNYFYKIYPIYEQKLEKLKFEKGIITTNDLIKYAVKILQNKNIKNHILNSIEYLFLDEAQDINYQQANLIELLISYGVKVFVVGDAKQSIYGFRGSDKNAFNHLIDYIKTNKGKQYTLDINYRANKFIVDKINNLFKRTFKFKHSKLSFENQKMIANNKNVVKNSIQITFNEDLAETIKNLSLNIENHEKVSYNDIAVLCRTNKEVLKTYYILSKANIPTQLYISKSIYKSKVILDICKLFNYITGGGNLEKEELFYTDFYLSAIAHKLTEQEFYNKVDNTITTFKQSGLLLSLTQILEDCMLLDYYSKIDDKQSIANIQRFTEILRDLIDDNLTSMEIINYLNIMIISKQEEGQPQVHQKDSVTVSTIHSYKGLDNSVIIVNEIDNNLNKLHFADFHYTKSEGLSFNKNNLIPNANIDNDKNFELAKKEIVIDNLEEELRLLYVAMTRAKNKLILNTRKSLDKIKYQIAMNKEYVSYFRWLYNI